ncbi:MAG: DUF4157 domain-containing protein [Acidimicrobiales bacterium]|nr:DUF4157 domain-containing protein [Acidimicrobiales bacterium]MDG2217151.1 DUF4157 domain-containing protein [Acidimicrobiales bacterium]
MERKQVVRESMDAVVSERSPDSANSVKEPSRKLGAVAAMLRLQTKLLVGGTDDPAEREADAVAADVMSRIRRNAVVEHLPEVNRSPAQRIRRSAVVGTEGGSVDSDTEQRIRARRGGGSPLPADVAEQMGVGFGADFSDVRLHTGSESAELNSRIQARAFTIGPDVFLGDGADIRSGAGQELLAHELAHTIQQDGASADTGRRTVDAVSQKAISRPDFASVPAVAGSVIRRRQPSGWRADDESTWVPTHYSTIDCSLVADALETLDLGSNPKEGVAWAEVALMKGLVGRGPIRSTYKSSYDQEPDAFSVSQEVPNISQLVVHGHIKGDNALAVDGGVNLKWAHDEGGQKASPVEEGKAAELIDVSRARAAWEAHPEHDQAEAAAKAKLSEKAKEQDAKAKKKEDEAAKEKRERALLRLGWRDARDKPAFGQRLKEAQGAANGGDRDLLDALYDELSVKAASEPSPEDN